MTNKYFLFEDISSQWLEMAKEAKAGQEIFIFSPFITGSLITEVCKVALSNPVFVITSLKPDAYLGGSLDVGVLTDLLSKNVKVFHHSKLHAKLMLVGTKLTVGSQNFTDGGKYNEETSLVCDVSKDQIESLEEKITDLLKVAFAIDKGILEKFVDDCEKIREQHEALQKLLEVVDIEIDTYVDLEVKRHEPELQEVEITKSNFGTNYVPIPIKVREKEYSLFYYGEYLDTASYYTLASSQKNEVLNKFWKTGLPQAHENLEHLKSQMRYLCFELNSLQLFWIRANAKQIGKFGLRCTFNGWKSPDGGGDIKVTLQNPYESEDFTNIKIQFDTQKYGRVYIGVLFTGTSFHLKSHSNRAKDKGGPVEVIKDWKTFLPLLIEPVLAELPSQILTPFNYSKQRLGISPARLFKANQLMKLGLQKYEDKLFYILDDV